MSRIEQALAQLGHLSYEVTKTVNGRWWRWFTCWFSEVVWVLVSYRVSRALYLAMGKSYIALRVVTAPVLFLIRPWLGGCDIHYRADIGRGLTVLHPALGVVVNGATVVGRNLTLTGGNCIGGRRSVRSGDIVLGDDVTLGANAVVLGPVRLGSGVRVGAGAVVVHGAGDGQILVGVPAVPLDGSHPSRKGASDPGC